jgi:toxin ParE1/3/4
MKIVVTGPARDDIDGIHKYYLQKVNFKIAKQEKDKIIKRFKILKNFPLSGQVEDNEKFKDSEFRYLVQGNFKIVYKVEEDTVIILAVFHTSQNPDKMSI